MINGNSEGSGPRELGSVWREGQRVPEASLPGVAQVHAESGDGGEGGGWAKSNASWPYPAAPAPGVTCRAQAVGGGPGTRRGWVEVGPQQAKCSSDLGQGVSQGSRMDGRPQGVNLDHGQKHGKPGSGWAKQCSQARPRRSTPRLEAKGQGSKILSSRVLAAI